MIKKQSKPGTKAYIAYIEDNAADALLMKVACSKFGYEHLVVLKDGVEALSYLNREGDYTNTPLPNLILLDLNLPRMRGNEVLKSLKSHPALRTIPILIFSSSERYEDVKDAYLNYANSFIVKPQDLDDFENTIEAVLHYWFQRVTLAE